MEFSFFSLYTLPFRVCLAFPFSKLLWNVMDRAGALNMRQWRANLKSIHASSHLLVSYFFREFYFNFVRVRCIHIPSCINLEWLEIINSNYTRHRNESMHIKWVWVCLSAFVGFFISIFSFWKCANARIASSHRRFYMSACTQSKYWNSIFAREIAHNSSIHWNYKSHWISLHCRSDWAVRLFLAAPL